MLLTGATGVVGRALLERLNGSSVICLIHNQPLVARAVRTIRGDVSQPGLGLARNERRVLAGEIDCIVHSAAITNFGRPEEEIERTNVDGTRHVLELAAEASADVFFISTAFATDGEPGDDTTQKPNVYEVSKKAAERLVQRSGVPNVIVRPSIVVGHSKTGAMAQFQGFHHLLNLFLTGFLPVVPARPGSYCDFVPQDVVADSIADLVEHGIVGEEYWITSGDRALSLQQLVDVCVEHVPRLTGRSIDRPRMCEPDMFERLFLPVFLPALPSALREPLVQAMGFVKYLTIEKALPSSLPHLEKTLATGALPDPAVTLQANLAFWAARRDWVS